ncbi:MAG: TonB-dependent receptor [Maricaulaceae bacterium]
MKHHLWRSASAAALVLGLAGWTGAVAQDDEEAGDVIVVTGSLIEGASESAALPVDVYTSEDSFLQGNQDALEFIKSLSIVGSTVGDTNQFQTGYGNIGSSAINLRGLGFGRTLTIFNGRRFTENTNMVPQIALARTEVLKDGGAVIYGADATGGVVNFITRDSFDGLQVDGEFKAIDGSDGDWGVGLLYGHDFESANLMFSFEWDHRSELDITDRDWAVRSFDENNTPWAPYHNYSTYLLNAPFGIAGVVADFSQDECEASSGPVEGQYRTISGLPVCWWNYAIHSYNLVEEYDQYRAYAQFTDDLSENVSFEASLAYGNSIVPNIGTVAAYQANEGPAPGGGTAFQFRVPRTNPYFDDFLTQNASQINPAVLPFITSADQFLSLFFGPSGTPHLGTGGVGTGPRTELENWNANATLDGRFDNFMGTGSWLDTWMVSMTFNHAVTDSTLPDMLGYRVQEALNGFGGPNCNAEDLVPDSFDLDTLDTDMNGSVSTSEFYAVVGTQNPAAAGQNGCMYLNPFSSSYAENQTFGQANPRYIAGNENPAELTEWLYDLRQTENAGDDLTIDALVAGSAPFELPGGQVAWAFGAQWRQEENRETSSSEFIDPDVLPCVWPGQQPGDVGCSPIGQTPYFFFASDDQTRSDSQQYSYFGELQVPLLDTLSMQVAVRREEFPQSDLGATVYKVAGRWEPTDFVTLRGSWGTNYATPPAGFVPGEISTGLRLINNAGNKYLRSQFETLSGLSPETAEVGNFGAIFNFDSGLPMDGALRVSVDYWTFEIIDEIKEINPNAIVDSVFVAALGQNQLIDCSAPLIDRITFIGGVGAAGCTQGTTIGDDITSILSVRGNGPGAITTGLDYDVNYTFGGLGGDIMLGLSATQITEYEVQAFELNGVQLSPTVDALGFANYSRDGDLVSELRGNATVNYAVGDHNLRYVLRYIQGVEDDRDGTQIDDFVTSNVYYQYSPPWVADLTLSLSVENALDEDPPFTRQQYSYDPFIGNPLGRTVEVGLRKTF